MIRFFKSRKPGPTDLTWEEKNFTDYIYHPKDTDKLQDFIRGGKEMIDSEYRYLEHDLIISGMKLLLKEHSIHTNNMSICGISLQEFTKEEVIQLFADYIFRAKPIFI